VPPISARLRPHHESRIQKQEACHDPRQREAYDWFATELANLRTAFRWAADHDDLNVAATIATYATFLGFWVEQFEPVAWAEELIEPACAVDHPRLAQLYAMATQCYAAGRLEDALAYVEAGLQAIDSNRFEPVPYDFEGWMGGPYIWTGVPERWLELCRNRIAQGRDSQYFAQANLVVALTFTGATDEGLAASEGLIAAADASHNPVVICYAHIAYGYPRRDTDPVTTIGGPIGQTGRRAPRRRQAVPGIPAQRTPGAGCRGWCGWRRWPTRVFLADSR
jgi:hypothetical protein